MVQNDPKWSNCVILWFKKWIFEIKFHQNLKKLSFFDNLHRYLEHKMPHLSRETVKIQSKRSKMSQYSQNPQNYIKIWFKKWISVIKIGQNHGKLSFSMVFIDIYTTLIEIPSTNSLKWSKMIQNDQKWSNYVKMGGLKTGFLTSKLIKIIVNLVFRWFPSIIIMFWSK